MATWSRCAVPGWAAPARASGLPSSWPAWPSEPVAPLGDPAASLGDPGGPPGEPARGSGPAGSGRGFCRRYRRLRGSAEWLGGVPPAGAEASPLTGETTCSMASGSAFGPCKPAGLRDVKLWLFGKGTGLMDRHNNVPMWDCSKPSSCTDAAPNRGLSGSQCSCPQARLMKLKSCPQARLMVLKSGLKISNRAHGRAFRARLLPPAEDGKPASLYLI